MNSIKYWDTKLIFRNLLHFYAPIRNYEKDKKIPHAAFEPLQCLLIALTGVGTGWVSGYITRAGICT